MKKIIQSPTWDRIVTILKNETLCVNELARRIGLERPHMIEAAKDPATGICPELAARIHYAFPAYSIEWLRTGLGPHPATREEAHPRAEVSLSGRWALLRTEHYWSDGRRPGAWLPGEIFEPGVVVWDFGPDGLLDRFESYLKVATVPYAFDRPRGWLLHEGRPVLVEKPTPVELEFLEDLVGHGDGPRCAFRIQKGRVRLIWAARLSVRFNSCLPLDAAAGVRIGRRQWIAGQIVRVGWGRVLRDGGGVRVWKR